VGVLLRPDGSASRATIRHSPGYPVVDSAAIRATESRTFPLVRNTKGKLDSTWVEQSFTYQFGLECPDSAGLCFSPDLLRLVTLPRISTEVEAAYPYWARLFGLKGTVEVALWLRKDGLVSLATFRRKSGNPKLDTLAVKADLLCKFTPALDSAGKPINVWVERTTTFGSPKGRRWDPIARSMRARGCPCRAYCASMSSGNIWLFLVALTALLLHCGRDSVRVEQYCRHVVGHGSNATWSPDGRSIAFLQGNRAPRGGRRWPQGSSEAGPRCKSQ